MLRAYAATYAEVSPAAYLRPLARPLAHDLAGRCLAGRAALFSVAEALAAGGTLFRTPPSAGALGARLAQNTPTGSLPQPLLIAQGLSDDLVLPQIQARYVDTRCAAGQALEYRRYAGRDHLSLVAADSPLTADLMRWTHERFAALAPRPGCVLTGPA